MLFFRKILIAILVGSAALELVIAILLFLRPELEAVQFHIAISHDTLSLAHIMAEFAIFLAVICMVAAWKVFKKDPAGSLLSILCGLHWICLGVGLFLRYYEVKFLVMDTMRGFCLLALPYWISHLEKRS